MYSVCILIYVSMCLDSCPSTHGISGLAADGASEQFEVRLKMTIQWTQRYTPRPWSSKFEDAIGDRDWVNSEMHWEAIIERVLICTWSPRPSELKQALWGRDQACLEMQLETEIEWTQRYTWRPWSSELTDTLRDRNQASMEIHLEAMIVLTWTQWSSEFGGHNHASLEIHLEAVNEQVWGCTWMPWSSEFQWVLRGSRWTARRWLRLYSSVS